jgi:hypothetical protein
VAKRLKTGWANSDYDADAVLKGRGFQPRRNYRKIYSGIGKNFSSTWFSGAWNSFETEWWCG